MKCPFTGSAMGCQGGADFEFVGCSTGSQWQTAGCPMYTCQELPTDLTVTMGQGF